ncbi:hypothetical protein MASR2M78_21450 [Treponema sp.]
MQEAKNTKMFFYVDESGDPTILGRKGKTLLEDGMVSKTFMVGYVETTDPASIIKDCSEVKERVFKLLKRTDFKTFIIVARKIDIYFAAMGNTVREHTMRKAIDEVIETFRQKWDTEHHNSIRIFVQQSSQIPMLQVVDYMLWAVNRVYEKGDYRHYRFTKDKIALVQDIFDLAKYPRTYYTPDNPLEPNKMSPTGG